MASCIQSITDKINLGQVDSITEILPNTLMAISMTVASKQLLRLTIVRQETAQFTISLTSVISPTNVGVTISIYQLSGNIALFLGSVLVTEMITTFQKDFSIGEYVFCIGSSSISYTGTFIGQFTGYPTYAKLSPNAYTGAALNSFDLSFPHIDKECNKLLYYEIVDGSLPDGLQMTLAGTIWGILPNLDCTHDNDDLSPSQNWYYEMDDTWQPWGRQWRFKVKLWIVEDPTTWTDRWFCIRVHNNWSWDRDNRPPIEYEEEIIEEVLPQPMLDLCCEEPPEVLTFTPQPVPVSLCPCDSETSSEQEVVLNFLQWYNNLLENPPGEDNPYIQTFIDNFKKTEYFKSMMDKAGLSDTLLTDEEKEKIAVSNLIEFYSSQLTPEMRRKEDIDYVMLELRDKENQKLPITVLSQSGTYLNADLWTPSK